MRAIRLAFLTFFLLAMHATKSNAAATAKSKPPARDQHLPPSEQTAKDALDHSPRHGEYVDVTVPSGGAIRTWVSYPERPDKAGVVLVIHEIFGLSDWVRGVADALAREGFIAIVPDLISGLGPGGGGTDSVPGRDDVVKLVIALKPEDVKSRLDVIRDYALSLPPANGKLATIGFCWGGGQSFRYAATSAAPIQATVVYYGTPPDSATLAQVQAPVLGLYGGDDARVTSTIEPARAALKKLGKSYEPHVFAGAGHGFLRAQEDRNGANLEATRKAWPLTIAFLKKHLK